MDLRVKEICKSKGLLMEELASRLGIARVNLTKTINGNPTIGTLDKIANVLGVPFIELFESPASGSIICPKCGTAIKLSAEPLSNE